ncbi:ATP-dependent zinc metalloprotease FtsH [Acaryochloris thomasi RCC1774]|uniref:ATP-dependent zinc metalloprotease FtsH n=1 Tax=Acaryochloris thomasi RCC1774 TaxID=1764569 RepID=A0A2W1JPP3_9CYAN|nr:ATP-binding protein [Acaryochloris thomasi]PZD70857.1 ATP-dependent zinc metalloprotease FtsH [Acaryochloris thomasi RCC1774]
MIFSSKSDDWDKLNRRDLVAAIDGVFKTLHDYVDESKNHTSSHRFRSNTSNAVHSQEVNMSVPTALEQVCKHFGLTDFERSVLLLCAGTELDTRFQPLYAKAHGTSSHRYYPTFGLALSVLPNPHWSALISNGPLRHWNLIRLGQGDALTNRSLYIDERILHYLVGTQAIDASLTEISDLPQETRQLVPSHQRLADEITALWQQQSSGDSLPAIQLCGPEIEDKTDIAQVVCHQSKQRVSSMSCNRLPVNSEDLAAFIRRWERESILEQRILLLNCNDLDRSDQLLQSALNHLLEEVEGPVIITCRTPFQGIRRQMIRFDVPKPFPQEQLMSWEASIAELKAQLNGQGHLVPEPEQLSQDLQELTAQFQLGTSMIRQACTAAVGQLKTQSTPSLKQTLWQSCRVQARPGLDELAERLESKLSWDDLVLPPLQQETLESISAHVRQRAKVYERWGFAAKNRRGLGITALFAGPSGTGKTLAAGVLANELKLDLYKIELSSVVSKYIGETEKNLQRIFDAAETGGAILLFDEADSIFGKRSEVKDSKDRYANLEVSYLLQRMESYPGLAILTTNLQSSLDPAFLRRLRFVTQFSLPDAAHRAEIWRRVFPSTAPTAGLAFDRLAQLNTPGGNIRNIALNAAFIAADEGDSVQMKHILKATQTEYEKLGKSLTSVEVSGWVDEKVPI